MPTNKNALTRFKYLDDLLSDKHHYFGIVDLTEKVNERLCADGERAVTRRCIEKDLVYLEYGPFQADIERFRLDGKPCIRYEKPGYSIFTKKLSDEEENLLSEVLTTLGQFDGLDNFEWLDGLKKNLGIKGRPKIIHFQKNPYLKNSTLLGALFSAIAHKQVINLAYHTFKERKGKSVLIHPYLLKEYNGRWFLLGGSDQDGYVLTFAIDRIDGFQPMPTLTYKEPTTDLGERFDDIVGVTLPRDGKTETILLWVSESAFPYIDTKPLHGSQYVLKEPQAKKCREQYPTLTTGMFVQLKCIPNYELSQLLVSMLDGVIVLQPVSLRDSIAEIIATLHNSYSDLRT